MRLVAEISRPAPAHRAESADRRAAAGRHDDELAHYPCLDEIELSPGDAAAPPPARLRLGAWNIERGQAVEAIAERIAVAGLQVCLLSEADLGMARSGQRHAAREIAARLGWHALFAVEFVELGLGDGEEARRVAGQRNAAGLHGNAIVSALPLGAPRLLRYRAGLGKWWRRGLGQPRVGGRMALAAEVRTAGGPVLLVSTHLSSHAPPALRRAQIAELLAADWLRRAGAVLIGGDMNTSTFDPAGAARSGATRARLEAATPGRLTRPMPWEPMFGALAAAGFDWRAGNDSSPTQRSRADGRPAPPLGRLDWLFARGLAAARPATLPACGRDGGALSDHELIVAEFRRA